MYNSYMSKKSFIPKSLRPDVPGTIIQNDNGTQILSGITIDSILDTKYRRAIITKLLLNDASDFNDQCAVYKKVLEIMFPSIAKK